MNSILTVLTGIAGIVGMFGLWAYAWRLWKRALALTPSAAESKIASLRWRNEPTPDHGAGPATRGRFETQTEALERGPFDGAPVMRGRPSSDANTAFFSRSGVVVSMEASVDKTEILHDEDLLDAAPAPVSARTRKTRFFTGPPRPADKGR